MESNNEEISLTDSTVTNELESQSTCIVSQEKSNRVDSHEWSESRIDSCNNESKGIVNGWPI